MCRIWLRSGLASLIGVALVTLAVPAFAAPSTTVTYPRSASATRFSGLAFDTCDAPTTSAMSAWTASPYDGVGIYIGGPNRTCGQRNLNAGWVSTVSNQRWRIIPIYMGHQAPCTDRVSRIRFTAASATIDGTNDAKDAIAKAKALGIRAGSAIYGDMENYSSTDSVCRTAVLAFVSAWTKELHRQGYLSGVYAGLNSGAKHLSEAYNSTTYARPDALWIARWDGNSSLTGWAGIPDTQWSNRQRGKQYQGDHNETWGGVTINIDSDRFNAPVATVAYSYRITSSSSLNGRSSPSTSASIVRTYAPGTAVKVICQTPGSKVGASSVWDKLSDGNYVADHYMNTPSPTTYSAPLPRCTFGFQVTATTVSERTGPGTSYAVAKTLPRGALVWIFCQRSGTKVGTTSVWDRLDDGYYVSDHYVATPSTATYSPPIPRC